MSESNNKPPSLTYKPSAELVASLKSDFDNATQTFLDEFLKDLKHNLDELKFPEEERCQRIADVELLSRSEISILKLQFLESVSPSESSAKKAHFLERVQQQYTERMNENCKELQMIQEGTADSENQNHYTMLLEDLEVQKHKSNEDFEAWLIWKRDNSASKPVGS